jgi:hypothetical protein
MSWAFKQSFIDHPNQTYTELLKNIRGLLSGKYQQVPQMSAGHKLKLDTVQFIM